MIGASVSAGKRDRQGGATSSGLREIGTQWQCPQNQW